MLKTLRLCSRIGVRPFEETTKNGKNLWRNRVEHKLLQHVASEDVFFEFEGLWSLLRVPRGRFWVHLGVPGGSKRASKIKQGRLTPRFLVPGWPWKASGDDFGWNLGGLGCFWGSFRGAKVAFWADIGLFFRAFPTNTRHKIQHNRYTTSAAKTTPNHKDTARTRPTRTARTTRTRRTTRTTQNEFHD